MWGSLATTYKVNKERNPQINGTRETVMLVWMWDSGLYTLNYVYFDSQNIRKWNPLYFVGFNFSLFKSNPMAFWTSAPPSQPEDKGTELAPQWEEDSGCLVAAGPQRGGWLGDNEVRNPAACMSVPA